jgi:hypothetical protein
MENNNEDYLKDYLKSIENGNGVNNHKVVNEIDSSFGTISKDSRTTDLQFLTFDPKELPCGKFYPTGTIILIRAAQVREIQSYSMADDRNFYDVVEKMNDMLASCVRVKYPDGRMGTYLDIKDQDRLYLIFTIRELTFQKGNTLSVKVNCEHCGTENSIELVRQNFRFHKLDERIESFYEPSRSAFIFETKSGKEFTLSPPTIGLQKAFGDFIIKENSEKRKLNMSFLKIVPYLLGDRTSITEEGIRKKLVEFEDMDDESFQFLNSVATKLVFGIKELSKICIECGLEVRTPMSFPNGASGIFIIHDAFEKFIKK